MQSKKGRQWHFGAHIGADAQSGLAHTVRGNAGNVHDVVEANALLHGDETAVFADAGYQGAHIRADARAGVTWHVAMRPGQRATLDKTRKVNRIINEFERLKASVRAKVEHPTQHAVRVGQSVDGAQDTQSTGWKSPSAAAIGT